MEAETVTLPRQPQRTKFKLRFNSLWTIWFCVLIVCVELYLVIESIGSYTVYNSMTWPKGKPTAAINSILVFAVLSILCMPMFVVSCVAKVGNLANDEIKLGTDPMKEIWHKRERLSVLSRFWRDFGPTAQVIHIVASFMLLLPRPFIEAELIKAQILSREDTWWSDLSVLFPLTNEQLVNVTVERAAAAEAGFISMEFINYALAYFMFMIRYAAVFWHTNLPFSCLFSIQLFLLTVQSVISFCAFSVVYKAQINADLLPNVDFLLSGGATVALYLISSGLVFFQNIAVFEYGYQQYVNSRDRTRRKVWPNYEKPSQVRSNLYGYAPHIVAMSSMLVSAIFKVPFLYDGGVIYRWYNDKLILWCIIGEVCYFMFWIILWFFLTVKQKWSFHFKLPSWYQEKSNLFTIKNEAFQESASDLTLDAVHGGKVPVRYDDRPEPSGSTVIPNQQIVHAEMEREYQPSMRNGPRSDGRMDLQMHRDSLAVMKHRGDGGGYSPQYQEARYVAEYNAHHSERRLSQSEHNNSAPMSSGGGRRHSHSDYPSVNSTSVVRDPGMVATVNIKITPNPDGQKKPQVASKPLSRTPSHSTPCTPASSRPTTPTRSLTPKPRRENLSRSNSAKKRNRVTFEDCIRNTNQYSDSDEPKSDEDSNSSNNSEPKPVGILKKTNAPKSPSAKDIARAIEGIKKAAKDIRHPRQHSAPAPAPGPGALQPQIRSKVHHRRDSKSSDISESPDRDMYCSLPRNYRTPEDQRRMAIPELQNSRGQPAYSSTGRGILKARADGRSQVTDRLPIMLDMQLDSGVELSDSSSMAYGPASPPIIANQNRDSANFSMSSQDCSPQDKSKEGSLCSQV